MHVHVLFFGLLRDTFHEEGRSVELPAGSTVADLVRACRQAAPDSSIWSSLAVAVNQEYVGLNLCLNEGDEVALLPPVSGGAAETEERPGTAFPSALLTRKAIDRDAVVASLQAGEDGALVIFDGIVRNNTRGRRTLYLDYTSYETMALLEMNRLVEEARKQFAVREIAVRHRLGRLEIGETSVLIVVASAHRGAAFDACRWMIDSLKTTVPIWKQEIFVDGAVWSDGEPFPEEVRTRNQQPQVENLR